MNTQTVQNREVASGARSEAYIPSYARGVAPLVEIRNLTKKVGSAKGEQTILDNINLNIYPGEYIMLFGLSGSGKTALASQIMGVEKPTSGQIVVGGRDIVRMSTADLAHYRLAALGMVYQDENIINSLTVLENIELPAMLAGIDEKKRRQLALRLMEMFRIQDMAERMPADLSAGQRRIVAIVRALINSPLLLIADGVTENLDTKSIDDVMENLRFVNEQSGMTTVLVANSPALVHYPNRIVYLTDGKITRMIENRPMRQR